MAIVASCPMRRSRLPGLPFAGVKLAPPLFQRQNDLPDTRIGDPRARRQVFKCVAKGIERGNPVRRAFAREAMSSIRAMMQ